MAGVAGGLAMSGGEVGCGGEPSGETVFRNFSRATGRLCRQRDPQVEAVRGWEF